MASDQVVTQAVNSLAKEIEAIKMILGRIEKQLTVSLERIALALEVGKKPYN